MTSAPSDSGSAFRKADRLAVARRLGVRAGGRCRGSTASSPRWLRPGREDAHDRALPGGDADEVERRLRRRLVAPRRGSRRAHRSGRNQRAGRAICIVWPRGCRRSRQGPAGPHRHIDGRQGPAQLFGGHLRSEAVAMRDLYLAIDVGTGSIRSALVDRSGAILALGQPRARADRAAVRLVRAAPGRLVGRHRRDDPRGAGPGRERAGAGRRALRLRPDARHRADRRRRPADARDRAALERQAHRSPTSRRSPRATPPAEYLGADREPAEPGLARLQAALDRRERPRRPRARRARC